jgi:hypothetical protein
MLFPHKELLSYHLLQWLTSTKAVVTSYTSSQNISYSLEQVKISVDVGVFIPGTFRINPYTVFEERLGECVTSFTLEAVVGLYTYRLSQTGNFLTAVVNQLHAKIPQPTQYSVQKGYALQKAYAKVGESGAGLGEDLVEIRQTIDLVRHPFQGLRDYLFNQNHKKLGLMQKILHFEKTKMWSGRKGLVGGAEAAKVAADSWLQLRYGLLPMIFTVQDVIKVVNTKLEKLDPSFIRSVHAKVKDTVSSSGPSFPVSAGYIYSMIYPEVKDNIVARAAVQYRMSGTPTRLEQLGLSPQYLPELMWDLTTLSFVVDWWFDVGTWLGTLRINPQCNILGNTVGLKVDRVISVKMSSRILGLSTTLRPLGTIGTMENAYYYRSCNESLPLLPVLNLNFKSIIHAVDAAALILSPTLKALMKAKRS